MFQQCLLLTWLLSGSHTLIVKCDLQHINTSVPVAIGAVAHLHVVTDVCCAHHRCIGAHELSSTMVVPTSWTRWAPPWACAETRL